MEPRLKWNKIILAAKIILFHLRLLSVRCLYVSLRCVIVRVCVLVRHSSVQSSLYVCACQALECTVLLVCVCLSGTRVYSPPCMCMLVRHSSVQSSGVDLPAAVPRHAGHNVVTWHPAVWLGLWWHPVWDWWRHCACSAVVQGRRASRYDPRHAWPTSHLEEKCRVSFNSTQNSRAFSQSCSSESVLILDSRLIELDSCFRSLKPPPQPFYGPFTRTTRVSRCQKRTSGIYAARED